MEKNTTTPTASQVEVLLSDWLGNLRTKEDRDFVHKGKGGIRRTGKGSVADYILGDTAGLGQAELIKAGRKGSVQVVNSIVDGQADVIVGGGTSFHICDSGKHLINVSTDYFDDSSISRRDKLEIMLGLATHEASHAAYTDSGLKDEMLEKEPAQTRELKKDIWNIIEDERIEYHLGEDSPGFTELLGATKRYYFKKLVNDMRTNGQMPTEPVPKLLSALTQAVRYPSQLTREDVLDSFDELDAIRRALTPFPLTPEDTIRATDRVMDIIKDIVRKDLEDKQKQQEQQEQQQPQDGGPSGGEGDKQKDGDGDGKNGGSPQGPGKDENKDGDGDSPAPRKEPTEQEVLDAIARALQTQEGKKVMRAIEQDEKKAEGTKTARAVRDPEKAEFINDDSAEIDHGGPGDPDTFIFKPKGTPESYNESLSRVRAYVPAMSKALACKSRDTDYELRGLPSGKLNTNKLVSFRTGNPNIFDKQGTVTCSSASVCILLDESGSMYGEKLKTARAASILINEAVARIPKVNFFCYGYTSNQVNVYSEAGRTSRWALGATEASGGTPTGTAMRIAARRIRRHTPDPVLMLVLTDGGADDNNEVARANEELRAQRFSVIGVGIQTDYVRSSFKENIVVYDLSRFATDLGRLTRGRLDRMLVRTEA